MDIGAIVDIALGIIFVWIVLSLTTIQIQEWISSRLDRRAKDMEMAIHEMLANPNLKDQFYDHPVIRGLTARKNRKEPSKIPTWFYRFPLLRGFTKEKRKLPSYIPSQQFAIALFDIALTANTESSLIQQGIFKLRDDLQKDRQITGHDAVIEELNLLAEFARSAAATEAGTAITLRTRDTLRDNVEHFIENFREHHKDIKLDDKVVRILTDGMANTLKEAKKLKGDMDKVVAAQTGGMDKALEEAKKHGDDMEKVVAAQATDSDTTLTKIRRGVAALSVISPEINQTLNALLMNVEEYVGEKEKLLARARGNVENWFDDSMDRVSGEYKRYSQNLALVIGFVLAMFMNVDSVNLTTYLWQDPSVRQALANQAEAFQLPKEQLKDNPQQAMQNFRNQFSGLNLPVGWTLKDKNDPIFALPNTESGAGCKWSPKGTGYFGIPLFQYKFTNVGPFRDMCLTPSQPDKSTNLLLKVLGIAITAVAARQGAPFWFDVLKRLVNLRSTGANPVEKGSK